MANQDMKAKLVIQASATGGDEIEALAQELEAVAREGGEAAPKFDELAKSLRQLGAQDALITQFAQLRRQAQETAQAMDAASATVDQLGQELQQAGQAASQAAAQQAQAAQQLEQARARQQQLKDAVAQTRQELDQSRSAFKQAGDGGAQFAQQMADSAAQLQQLQAQQREAATTVRQLAAAHKESEAANRTATEAQKQAAAEYDRAVKNAGQLSSTMRQHNLELEQARQALQAAGIDTKGLSDQQIELKQRLLQAQQQAQQYARAVREMRGETQALASALEQTFKQLGMRGVQQIIAEIEQLQAAMRGLRDQKMLPEDAARAAAQLQQRIEALRAEMGSTQGAAKGAAQAVQQVGSASSQAGNAMGEAAHKAAAWAGAFVGLGQLQQVAKAVLETGSSFEQLERQLVTILGSTDKAREAFAMIKDLAQKTPFDVQGLTEAYAKLSAFGLQPTRAQMLAMADAAAALGGGTEMLSGVTLALGQAWVKGKLQGEEILQLAERGVPAWDLLAKATGKNVAELQKMAEAGQLGRDVILQLIDAMGQKNAGASADLMNTYAGAVQRAHDALKEFYNMIAQSGVLEYLTQQLQGLLLKFDQLKASGELEQWAKSIANGFKEVAETAQNVFAVLQALEPVLKMVVAAMVVSKVAQWTTALSDAGKAAGAAASENDKLARSAKGAGLASEVAGGLMRQGIGLAAVWSVGKVFDLVDALGQLKRARERVAEAQQTKAKLDAEEAQRYREISVATGVLVTSFEEVMDAQKRGLLVQDAATGKWLSAAQAQEALAGAVKKTTAELAQLDAEALVKGFDEAVKQAGNVEEALKKVSTALKFNDLKSVSTFALGLEGLADTGKATAQQVGDAWQEALGKLNAGQIGVLRFQLEEASRQGILSAEQWARANEQILAASFEKLGVNAAQALGKISTGAKDAIGSIDLVADSAKAAGVGVQDAARAIEMAFAAAIPKADSLQAIDALEQKLKAMGAAGQISAQGLERTQIALDKQRAAIEGQIPGIQSMEEALRSLGVTPQKELDALATSAKQAFEAVRASGTATPREINEAWKAMAEASIAANDGVADAVIQAEAQARGFAVVTDESGKSVIKTLAEVQGKTEGVGDALTKAGEKGKDAMGKIDYAAQMAGKSMEELEAIMNSWSAGKDMADSAAMANAAANELTNQWRQAQVQADAYYQDLFKIYAKHEDFAGLNPWQLEKEIWRASEALQELDRQQQAVERSSSDATTGLQSLEDRLLELSGSEETVALRRKERDQAEIQKKMALLQLDIQRANIRKNTEEAALLEAELQAYQKQLQLIDQIYRQEKKMREEEERAAKEAEKQRQEEDRARQQEEKKRRQEDDARDRAARDAAGGGSSASITAAPAPRAVPTAPINITLNANGINDPAKLARMLEPELKKIAALAR